MSFRGQACAYCGQPATGRDHIIPKTMARKRKGLIPDDLLATVPCCLNCNVRKSTRKLVPPSWEGNIPALKEVIPGAWRTWNGDPRSKSFSAVHV